VKDFASLLKSKFRYENVIILVSLLCLAVCAPSAHAQSGAGSIQGTVNDATGAVIAGASIHVVNTATAVATDTKSNGVGFYQVPELFTGTYKVNVTAPGMKTYTTSVELQVAQNAVINPILTAGDVTQQITVNADTVQLVTQDTGSIGSTLENERINQLPMNGRNILSLVGESTPGMEDNGQKMDGQAIEALDYLVDGTSTQNNLFGGQNKDDNGQSGNAPTGGSTPPVQLLDADAIQEVRVQSANSGAQYGAPATALLTTKSGTNALHGTFFETARNNAFGLARRREDPVNIAAPHLVRNEFGASAGGPIVLPHLYHGKDKSFWFFSFERYSLAQSKSALVAVPTSAMRTGDFSGLITSAGVLQTLYDPATTQANAKCVVPGSTSTTNNPYCRTPFQGNVVPNGQMSPIAKLYAQLIPAPTTTDDPLVKGNLTTQSPNYQVIPQATFRLDHKFNDNNRAYLRYTQNISSINSTSSGLVNLPITFNGLDIPAGAAFGWSNSPLSSFLAAANYTHIFSPTFFSETNISQQWLNDAQVPGTAINTNYESKLGLPNNFGEVGFPSITGQIVGLGTTQAGTAKISQIVSSIDENLTKIVGRHQMYFGGRFRHTRNADLPNGSADTISYGANSVALYNPTSKTNYNPYSNTGNANAAFFIGSAGSYNVHLEPAHVHYRLLEYDAYFQDDYHVKKNLTLNLGLRYEAHPAISVKDNETATFDLKNDALVMGDSISNLIAKGYTTQAIITNDQLIGVNFETAQQAGYPSKLMRDYNYVFLPRFGFAYVPFQNKWGTVIRGAFGRYDYPTPLEDYENHPQASNPFTATFAQSYSAANQAIDGYPNELLRYNDPVVFGVTGVNTANIVDSSSTTSILPGLTPFLVAPNWAPTFVSETNFTIEQPIKGHSVVRASYIWNHSSNLDVIMHPNAHPSTYQWEMATGTALPKGGASVIGTPQQNTYAATATGPYDQTTWGNFTWHTRAGWSNYNALQLNYQRLYHHGYSYQFTYVFAKAMRMGGNQVDALSSGNPYASYPGALGTRGTMTPTADDGPIYAGVAPPPPPAGTAVWADYHELNYFEQYQLDNAQPTTHIRFNWLVDLPLGRGKRFFGSSNKFVDEIIGGFQLAGDSNIFASLVQTTSQANWGAVAPLQIYKHKYPVTDCTSGVCYKEYLWFNGYQSPKTTTGLSDSTCTTNCLSGLPASYVPDQAPIDNTPGTTDFGANNVLVTLTDGTQQSVSYDAGPTDTNYLGKTWIHGPVNWPVDASLFKAFPITERVNLRVNLDVFNVFNMPGENSPGTGGLQKFNTSNNAPRQLQITARVTF
jgi:Carboxypeptidase regulatory-like domain